MTDQENIDDDDHQEIKRQVEENVRCGGAVWGGADGQEERG